jgi:hypothetical protein
MAQQRAPGIFILNQNAQREQGRKAQTANIKAARVCCPIYVNKISLGCC